MCRCTRQMCQSPWFWFWTEIRVPQIKTCPHPSPYLCLAMRWFPFREHTEATHKSQTLQVSAWWRSENRSALVQRETISPVSLYLPVCGMFVRLLFVGVCTDVKREGVQGHHRTNSLVDHLLEMRQKRDTSAKGKKEERDKCWRRQFSEEFESERKRKTVWT